MRKLILSIFIVLAFSNLFAKNYKPYILAGLSNKTVQEAEVLLEKNLKANGFDIVGKYSPMDETNRVVVCATHKLILDSVKKSDEKLIGFASAMRFGLYKNKSGKIEVTFNNPIYWGLAYFRKEFSEIEANYNKLNEKAKSSFTWLDEKKMEEYGSKNGLSESKLKKYHYMMFMPYFDDAIKLGSENYEELVKKVEENLQKQKSGCKKVYRIDIQGKKATVFGIALTNKSKGEKKFIPTIDFATPRSTTFAPYELLITENRAYMLHGKYRIALSFPDLTMVTFMKISFTPGHIEDQLESLIRN